MLDHSLRRELLSLRDDDLTLREELLAADELRGPYHPRMEATHIKNAARLRELIAEHGWPAEDLAGPDGAEAAWLIAQHSIGLPQFMRTALRLIQACIKQGRVPAWHAAFLEDRIALYEGRPQRFGTQSIDDPRDGCSRPWTIADADHVNDLRASIGLRPLPPTPPPGPDLPRETRRQNESLQKWWLAWLASRGWRTC